MSYVSTPTTHRACLTSTLSLFFYRLVLTTSRVVCHLLRLSSGRPSKCVKTTFTQTLSMRSASCSKRTNTRLLTDTSRSPTLLMLSRYPNFQEKRFIEVISVSFNWISTARFYKLPAAKFHFKETNKNIQRFEK